MYKPGVAVSAAVADPLFSVALLMKRLSPRAIGDLRAPRVFGHNDVQTDGYERRHP